MSIPTPPTPAPPPDGGPPAQAKAAATQGKAGFRKNLPEWIRQLPRLNFDAAPNSGFELINRAKLREALKNEDPDSLRKIEEDLDFLDHELMRLFRDRDFEASKQQNRYRLYQLGFMGLATLATLFGSLLAVALDKSPNLVPLLAFGETVVALFTTYLATISGREAPLPLWLSNRRRAEHMRREYFRYLMDLPPYDSVSGYSRRYLLSKRAADINRGVYPDSGGEG